ncbi:MAG: carboxypeptidase regulatory-like domain-containing protein [Bacteroidota bacterium]
MKKLLSSLILICSFGFLLAQFPGGGGRPGSSQPKITGKITGTIQDSTSKDALEFATISLKRAGRDKSINGDLTDSNGKFKLSGINLGKYEVHLTFLGYRTKVVKDIKLTPEKPDVDLGKIELVSEGLQMEAVDITAEKALIENKIDKIVYNAELDVTTTGGDATEVLRKVPLLNVDINGNVSLRGSRNLQILINGKPSGMFSNNVADALKMIPADEIKSVEVITTPGAKYDAEGTGGIINIITKKKKVEGASGNVSASIGNRQNRGTMNLNLNKGRFGFNMGGSVDYSWPIDGPSTYLREDFVDGLTRTLRQDGNTETTRTGFGGRAGLFYDFNAFNSINSNFRVRGFTFDRDGFQDAIFSDPILNINQNYRQNQLTGSLFSGFDWTTDYTKKFKENKEKELTFGHLSNRA